MNGGFSPPGESTAARSSNVKPNPQRKPSAIEPQPAASRSDGHSFQRDATHTPTPYTTSSNHSDTSRADPTSSLSPSETTHCCTHANACERSVSRKKHQAKQTQWNVSTRQ